MRIFNSRLTCKTLAFLKLPEMYSTSASWEDNHLQPRATSKDITGGDIQRSTSSLETTYYCNGGWINRPYLEVEELLKTVVLSTTLKREIGRHPIRVKFK